MIARQARSSRRTPRLRRLSVTATIAVVLITTLGTMAAMAAGELIRSMVFTAGHGQDDLLVVLAIGSDEGPPHRSGNPMDARADGIHLLAVDTRNPAMTIVDIPRDSAIGGTKVNAHLAYGGPERLEAQIEAWSGIEIDYWVLGSFWSLEQIALGLGGIEVDVPRPMNDRFSGTNIQAGFQRLGPGQALAYTRDRKSQPDGDIGRTRNQGAMIASGLQQMRAVSQGRPAELLRLVQLFERSTAHNIPATEVLPIALTVLRIEPTAVRQDTISGPFGTIGGSSVIRPQPGDVLTRIQAGQVGP